MLSIVSNEKVVRPMMLLKNVSDDFFPQPPRFSRSYKASKNVEASIAKALRPKGGPTPQGLALKRHV